MGFVYREGDSPKRPAVYRRSSNDGSSSSIVSALDGYGALPVKTSWGPLGQVTTHYSKEYKKTVKKMYGEGGTLSVVSAYMAGGLSTLRLYRLGNGGEKGTLTLKSGESEAVVLTLKYPGERALTASVRDSLSEENMRELVIYDGAVELESISFEAGENEPKNLATAVTAQKSEYVTAKATENVTGALTEVAQQEFTGGKDPVVTNDDYMSAFEAFEPYFYNTIALDTTDPAVQMLLLEYLAAAADEGNLGLSVIGESGKSALSDRMKHAAQKNSATTIYFGSDYESADGTVISGAEAIATVAGVIASTPSNESIVHSQMPGATNVTEHLKNREYNQAIESGLLLLSVMANGTVGFDSGVNTLIDPSDEQDEGWKKIKRVKVRHEVFNRLDRQLEPMIGKVDGTKDGIADVIQTGQKVLDEMVRERKLINPSFILDEEKGYGADFAYFIIEAVDVDTLERIFLNYKFKYSENS